MYVCVSMCEYDHVSPGGLGGPEGIGYLELELQGVVNHQCGVLGIYLSPLQKMEGLLTTGPFLLPQIHL